jgi:hypothetical protein
MRLGDSERSSIKSAFRAVANKAKNSKVFPLTEEDFPDFGYSLLEPRIAKYYEFLRSEAEDLTSAATWNPSFNIRDANYLYDISIYGVTMPKEGLLVTEQHSMYAVLLKWGEEQNDIDDRVDSSMYYLSGIVESCSSTGQIKRVLQEDIIRFVPDYMQNTFKGAERRSRIPAGLELEDEKTEQLIDILALGAISPDNREGLNASVDSRQPI